MSSIGEWTFIYGEDYTQHGVVHLPLHWSRSAHGGSYAHLGVLTHGSLGVFEGDSSIGAYGVANDHFGGRGV